MTEAAVSGIEEQIEQVFNKAVDLLILKLQTVAPFLKVPVIKQVFEFGMRKLMSFLYRQLGDGIFILITRVRVAAEKRAFDAARDELKKLLTEKGAHDEEIKKAEAEFDRRADDLISFPR